MKKITLTLTDEQYSKFQKLSSNQNNDWLKEETFNEYALRITFADMGFKILDFIDGTINKNVIEIGEIDVEF